jgi:hypothetical protein
MVGTKENHSTQRPFTVSGWLASRATGWVPVIVFVLVLGSVVSGSAVAAEADSPAEASEDSELEGPPSEDSDIEGPPSEDTEIEGPTSEESEGEGSEGEGSESDDSNLGPPADGEKYGICKDDSTLSKVIDTILQLVLWNSIIGVVTMYLVTHFMMTIPFFPESITKLKRLRSRAISASIKAVIAGPLAVLVFDAAGFYWASECIDLNPWAGLNS